MTLITGLTRGGEVYNPTFVTDLKQSDCIGCGRCFHVCPRDVFDLVEREGALESVTDDYGDSDDDFEYGDYGDGFADDTAMVMSLKNALDCIGCGACARICPKKCFSHEPMPVNT